MRMERLAAIGLALATVTIALPAMAPSTAADVDADVRWSDPVCSSDGSDVCNMDAHGDHEVTLPDLAGNGFLNVEGEMCDIQDAQSSANTLLCPILCN